MCVVSPENITIGRTMLSENRELSHRVRYHPKYTSCVSVTLVGSRAMRWISIASLFPVHRISRKFHFDAAHQNRSDCFDVLKDPLLNCRGRGDEIKLILNEIVDLEYRCTKVLSHSDTFFEITFRIPSITVDKCVFHDSAITL